VGSGSERSRYLCLAFEVGAKARFTSGDPTAARGEAFIVVYYFTVTPGPAEVKVDLKVCLMSAPWRPPLASVSAGLVRTLGVRACLQNDVYLNDLVLVEYGPGTDFTITFDQTPPFHFSTNTPLQRDEIVWNILTVSPGRHVYLWPTPPLTMYGTGGCRCATSSAKAGLRRARWTSMGSA
jgi:hypothetical protein